MEKIKRNNNRGKSIKLLFLVGLMAMFIMLSDTVSAQSVTDEAFSKYSGTTNNEDGIMLSACADAIITNPTSGADFSIGSVIPFRGRATAVAGINHSYSISSYKWMQANGSAVFTARQVCEMSSAVYTLLKSAGSSINRNILYSGTTAPYDSPAGTFLSGLGQRVFFKVVDNYGYADCSSVLIDLYDCNYSLSSMSLSFSAEQGSAPASQTITVINNASFPLNIASISSDQSWLTVSPTSIASIPALGSATVNVTVGALSTTGTYTGNITFTDACGGNKTVTVTYQVTGAADGECGTANDYIYPYTATDFQGLSLCYRGTQIPSTVSFPSPGSSVSWQCQGTSTTDPCSASRGVAPPPVECGSAADGTFCKAPSTNLCSSGTASPTLLGNKWTWTCDRTNCQATYFCKSGTTEVIP